MHVHVMIKNGKSLTELEIDIFKDFGLNIKDKKEYIVGDIIINDLSDLMRFLSFINGEVKIDSEVNGFMNLKVDCLKDF